MRKNLLTVVGGTYFYEVRVAVQCGTKPVIWFNRDEDRHFLLNLRMLTTSTEPRAMVSDNDWITLGRPSDLECPPSGKRLKVQYDDGDRLMIEFLELTEEAARSRYGWRSSWYDQALMGIGFPLTAVEIFMKVDES